MRLLAQTLRGALGSIDKHRQKLVSHHLQHAPVAGNANDSAGRSTGNSTGDRVQKRMRVALAKASITMSFHKDPECGDGAGGPDETLGEGKAAADMGFHELAALQLVSAIR